MLVARASRSLAVYRSRASGYIRLGLVLAVYRSRASARGYLALLVTLLQYSIKGYDIL